LRLFHAVVMWKKPFIVFCAIFEASAAVFSLVLWEVLHAPTSIPTPLLPPVNIPAWLWYVAVSPIGLSSVFLSSGVGEDKDLETTKVRYEQYLEGLTSCSM